MIGGAIYMPRARVEKSLAAVRFYYGRDPAELQGALTIRHQAPAMHQRVGLYGCFMAIWLSR
jgi:hypothetical protein